MELFYSVSLFITFYVWKEMKFVGLASLENKILHRFVSVQCQISPWIHQWAIFLTRRDYPRSARAIPSSATYSVLGCLVIPRVVNITSGCTFHNVHSSSLGLHWTHQAFYTDPEQPSYSDSTQSLLSLTRSETTTLRGRVHYRFVALVK